MGIFSSKLKGKKAINVTMVGLDSGGKSTILAKLKQPQHRTSSSMPTLYFDFEVITYKNLTVTLWDIDSDVKHPNLWSFLRTISYVIMFVVDSTDYETIEEAADELHSILSYVELRDAILLVIANKQDLPNAMGKTELTEKLRLKDITNRPWCVKKASGKTGKGLNKAFKWMYDNIQRRDDISK